MIAPKRLAAQVALGPGSGVRPHRPPMTLITSPGVVLGRPAGWRSKFPCFAPIPLPKCARPLWKRSWRPNNRLV
jgi:hypothetical protein